MKNRRRFDREYALASALWSRCEQLALKLTGQQVIAALDAASGKVYHVGYDDVFQSLRHGKKLTPAAVASHDVGWLTVFALELQSAGQRRSLTRRSK